MIGLPSETVTIDGDVYTIQLLDAIAGFRLYSKLLNAVGGSLASLGDLNVKGSVEDDASAQTDLALRAVGALVKGLSPDLLEELRGVFASNCTVQKEAKEPKVRDVFAFHFAGRYAHMSKWLFECARFNFADFLDDALIGQLSAKFQALKQSSSKPPTT